MNAKEVAFAGVFSVAGSLNSIKDYQDKSWNYNTNRNNMQENSLLYARLSLKVLYCQKS